MRYKFFFIPLFFVSYSLIFAQPNTIPGLVLWLSADTLVSLDVNGNDSIWIDRSGNGYDVNQPVISQRPGFGFSNSFRSKAVIFDGSPKFLLNSSMLTSAFPSQNATLIVFWSLTGIVQQYGVVATKYGNGYWRYSGDGKGYFQNFLSSRIDGYPASMPTTGIHISSLVVSATNYEFYLDGNSLGAQTPVWDVGTDFLVGRDEVGNFLTGEIAEIIIYDTALTTSQRLQVEQYIYNKYAPPVNLGADINVPYGFCDTTLNASARFISYLWSTGATTQTIQVNQSGTYSVTVTDIFGWISSDTINITYPGTFFPFPDTSICYGDTLIWNTQLNKSGYTFLWQDSSTDSVLNITQAGTYYVTVTDSFGCSRTSDTITVAIDNFPQLASLDADTSVCSGASIALISGASQATSYLWSTGATNSSIAIITSGAYSVIVQNANGCIAKDTINVNVKGIAPVVGFTAPAVCFGNSIVFTDTTDFFPPDSIKTWDWNFGDGAIDSVPNPVHSYTSAGTYIVTLSVMSDSGCPASVQKPVVVNPKPNASMSITTFPACTGSPVAFSDASSGSITGWSWSFGDGNTDNTNDPTPSHSYTSAGVYTSTLVVTSGFGCKDTTISTVTVSPTPVVSFSATNVCEGNATTLLGSSSQMSNTWLWDFGDVSPIFSGQNQQHTYSSSDTFYVLLTVTANNGCINSVTDTVVVYPLPNPGFITGISCVNNPAQFTDVSTINGSVIAAWSWNFQGGNPSVSSLTNPASTYSAAGTYSVSLTVTSAQTCTASVTQTVTVNPLPVPDFNFTPQYGAPPLNVAFTDASSGAVSYLWNFGDTGSTVSTLQNPSFTYLDTGHYVIQLITQSPFGCVDSVQDTIFVAEPILDIANTAISGLNQSGTLKIYTVLYNAGTLDVSSVELSAWLDGGNPIHETLSKLLKPDSSYTYLFNSSFEINSNHAQNMLCVEVKLVNGKNDDVLSNNKKCTAITNEFVLLDPFPNPASEEIFILFVSPDASDVKAEIFDMRGRLVEKVLDGKASEGLNTVIYNTIKLNKGNYVLRLSNSEKNITKAFMKE